MGQRSTSKERKHLQLRKQTANLQNNKKDRKASRMAIKQRKAISMTSGEHSERKDDGVASAVSKLPETERGIPQIEARLSQQLKQGHRPLIPLHLATYILTSKEYIQTTTDRDGNCIQNVWVEDIVHGRLRIDKISRRGNDVVEVKASLWFSICAIPCIKEQVRFTGSWPDLKVPALQEISVEFCDESQVRYRAQSRKQKKAKQESMRTTLVFLHNGYLEMKAQAVPYCGNREDVECYGIEGNLITERDSGLIAHLADSEPETTEASDEDTTDSESDTPAGDYDRARQKHAKKEARGRAIERWLEKRIAPGEEEDYESTEVRRAGLEYYFDVTWDLYSTAYLDMLVLRDRELDDKVFDGYSCGEFSFGWLSASLELWPLSDSWTGDFKYEMKKGVVNSSRLNAKICDEEFREIQFRICFVENGHMKIRIPAYKIGGPNTEDDFIDFYAIAQDLSDYWSVYKRCWKNTPRGLEYKPPTGSEEDSPSKCSDYSEDSETFDSWNSWE